VDDRALWGSESRMRKSARMLLAAFVAFAAPALLSARAFAGAEVLFPRPASIEPNIKFWVDVFSGYGERDFVIHDRDCLWRVYQVMHVPGDGLPTRAEAAGIEDYLKQKYATVLSRLIRLRRRTCGFSRACVSVSRKDCCAVATIGRRWSGSLKRLGCRRN
jgi:hypothetical protein